MQTLPLEGRSSPKPELLCKVCGDKASGKHYGVLSCDGCRGFFKRSIRRNLDYVCKENGNCVVDVSRRNQCQACRFNKCLEVNMKRDAVQHERAPRSFQVKRLAFSLDDGERAPLGWPHCYGSLSGFIACKALAPGPPPQPTNVFTLQDLTGNRRDKKEGEEESDIKSEVVSSSSPSFYPRDNEVKDTHQSSFAVSLDQSQQPFPLPQLQRHQLQLPSYSQIQIRNAANLQFQQQLFHTPTSTSDGNFSEGEAVPTVPTESTHESAARLLFVAVKWARSIPAFLQLPFRDQAILLEEAWSELFVLSAAQFALPIDEGVLTPGNLLTLDRQATLAAEVTHLREIIQRFQNLRVDHTEYACLKVLVLFKPETRGLRDCLQVELLQDQTHLMLQEYTLSKQPPSKIRFGKLLLLLPAIRSIRAAAIEDIFFRRTIGNVPIERLLCDMFKSS